jgi:hypothetical protein
MKRNILRGVLVILVCNLSLTIFSTSALAAAASSPSSVTNATDTLKISPIRTDLSINPGDTGIVKTYVSNLSKNPIEVQPIENDFISGNESGEPAIILGANSYAPTHSLKRFMLPLANVTVGPGATQEVDVSIVVPKTAQAGGYFGAVRFASATTDGSENVNLSTSAASLILLTVPGNIIDQLQLTNFDLQQNGNSVSSFRSPKNISVLVRFTNQGNVQEGPFGQVYVTKGNKTVYTYPFNQSQPAQVILPDSSRRWSVPLQNLGKFGKYTVGATFTYGAKGESIQVSKTFWIVPTIYIIGGIVAIAIVILIIIGIVLLIKSHRRKKSRKAKRRY